MDILIPIVMDKTNYRGMAQLSHIVAQLSYVEELGHDPCSITMTQLSHSVPTLHIWLSQLSLNPQFLLKSKSQNRFWRYSFLKCLDDRGAS